MSDMYSSAELLYICKSDIRVIEKLKVRMNSSQVC